VAWRVEHLSGANWPTWKGGKERRAEQARRKRMDPAVRAAQVAYCRAWRAANRGQARIHNQRRRALVATALGSFTLAAWEARFAFYGHRCYLCRAALTNATVTIEHRVPLSRGGTNWPANLAPACKSCNSAKGFKTEREYRRRLAHRQAA
jgi:5-methylcytosine-specific restriction endonuclease McrA